jgi:uncharacterized protein (TIGR03435 family)
MNRALLTTLLAALSLAAQSPAPTTTFEAATIKPSPPGRRGGGLNLQAARIRFINSTLKFCIQMAWDVQDFQVVGGPGWTDTDLYDIEAVAAVPFKGDEYRTMIQAFLADRFGLVIRHETQEKSGYALVVAKNGPKLPPPIEDRNFLFSRTPSGDIALKATNATLEQLAEGLSSRLRAIVVDKTGMEGKFDVSLQWTPDPSMESMARPGAGGPPPPPADAAQGPSIFTALQEKLGLKLESRKVPVEVIVIERANRPTAN